MTVVIEEADYAAYYLYSAGAHFDGVLSLVRQPDFGKDDRDYFPVCLLLCNALELVLKAYLLHRGITRQTLKNEYRHKLKETLREAVARGLEVNDTAYLADKLHPIHTSHSLRYCTPGVIKIGDLNRALDIMHALFAQVSGAVGPYVVALPQKP